MKKLLMIAALITPLIANAAFVGSTDVGDTDTFLFEGAKVGNTTAETAWVQTKLADTTIDWSVKVADVSYQETDISGVFAFDLLLEPDYFLVKNSTRMALFENVASLDWGVFDMSLLSGGFHFGDDFEISHVTELDSDCDDCGGSTHNVPEPNILALIGLGLALLGGRKILMG